MNKIELLEKYGKIYVYQDNVKNLEKFTDKFYDEDTPLHWAAFSGEYDDLKFMLNDIDLKDINVKGDIGNTPLLSAISGKKYDCVELLLQYGADFSIPNDYGDTPFDWADNKTLIILNKYKTSTPNNP